MTEEQAEHIVLLMRGATRGKPDETKIAYFETAMLGLDYAVALEAVQVGTVTWTTFPSWAEFKEIYRAHKRLAEPVGEQRTAIAEAPSSEVEDEGKRGDHAPEWVHIWSWCRLARSPRNFRGFPQQQGWEDPQNIMPMEEYEKLRAEWIAAGSPKSDNPLPMAR